MRNYLKETIKILKKLDYEEIKCVHFFVQGIAGGRNEQYTNFQK